MIIKHILKVFVLGIVVSIPFGLVMITNNYKIVSKKDDKSLNSVNQSNLILNPVDLEILSSSNNGETTHSIDLADSVYSRVNQIISNIYQVNSFQSEEGFSSNLLISDLSTLDLGISQNVLQTSDKNIYISIDEQGNIEEEMTLVSAELNELNNQLENELLVSSNDDVISGDKNIYISIDEQGNIDQKLIVGDSKEQLSVTESDDKQITVAENYEEQNINQDRSTDKVLVKIENIDGKIVQTVVSRETAETFETMATTKTAKSDITAKTAKEFIAGESTETFETVATAKTAETAKTDETALSANNYRDISMNERDIYSSLDEVDNNDKFAKKIVVTERDKEQSNNKSTVLEKAFAKIDSADKIDKVQTVNKAEPVKIVNTTKIVKTELLSDSDAEILSNDIELYGKIDMLDTATIEMIAYSNYMTEDRTTDNDVTAKDASATNVVTATVEELESKKLEVANANAKAKVDKLEVANANAKAEKLRVAKVREIAVIEHEKNLTSLVSAGNITQEFALLSPSLVNRSLSIDLSVGRTDIETPVLVEDIKDIDTDLILTDTLIDQKERMEIIIVDRSNREIKDERFYYSEKSITTIPSTVLKSTIKNVKTEKFSMPEFGNSLKQKSFMSALNPSLQCK